ncbi:MAG TPA: magnesium/cobalt transporter CorA [Solirubrobacterales bacterium]|nr:magnesium/cobalt transporter CorA [Solirubrobacterales bacterium]
MIVDCAHYEDGKRQHDGPIEVDDAASRCGKDAGSFAWVGLKEPTAEELERVGEAFGLHELALEDAMNAHQRPKLEDYDGSLFIVLRTARYDDAEEEVDFGEIHLFVGSNYVIAVRHGEASELTGARKRLEDHESLLGSGTGAVVWAIVDKVVDDYAPVVAGIDNDIEEVEEEIFGQRADATQRIYFLKREVIEFHRAVSPLLGPLEGLQYGAQPAVSDELRRFFRDVHDHARRVDEQVTGQRELLTSILEANLALLGVQQNAVVRQISAWAAIITVPTFLASVWGMNFEHMPELDETWAYPVALILMAVAVISLYRFFKRIDWL